MLTYADVCRRVLAYADVPGCAALGAAMHVCSSVRDSVLSEGEYDFEHVTVGVPHCVYQRSNCARSTLLASVGAYVSMRQHTSRKQSHVTAWPFKARFQLLPW